MDAGLKTAIQIGELLKKKGKTLTTAESCTGGGIAYMLTEVVGSSAWFERGFVTYCNKAKQEMLGVSPKTLLSHGAVSEEVAAEMAKGALKEAKADLALSVTGIAGPTGGSDVKPVGMVCFGWASAKGVFTGTCQFEGDRYQIRRSAIAHSLAQILLSLEAEKAEG